MEMATNGASVWRSFHALRAHVLASPVGGESEFVVEGQLMHQRRVSRRCSFFDLASVHESEPNTSERVEVILKIVQDKISTDEIDAIRHRINVGDIVHVRCRIETLRCSANSDGDHAPELLLHARDITTVTSWKQSHPGVPFVPIPTVYSKKEPKPLEPRTQDDDDDSTLKSPTQHCKFWINTGACQYGDRCEQYHAPKHEIKAARALWLEQRLHQKRERASQDADPHDAHGKTSKHQRASVFVEWLVTTFGATYLALGSGVMDVAGGRGNVSFELWNKRQIPSTLIDPRPMKLSRMQHKHFKKQRKMDKSLANTPLDEDALVPQKLVLFNTTTFFEDQENRTLVRDASVLVGMHPDEATDSIFDVALQHDKPFAVVPCCVFGQSFPDRRLPDGVTKVLSYEDLVEYLVAKHADIQKGFLPFDGKNLVLYRLPKPQEITSVLE